MQNYLALRVLCTFYNRSLSCLLETDKKSALDLYGQALGIILHLGLPHMWQMQVLHRSLMKICWNGGIVTSFYQLFLFIGHKVWGTRRNLPSIFHVALLPNVIIVKLLSFKIICRLQSYTTCACLNFVNNMKRTQNYVFGVFFTTIM